MQLEPVLLQRGPQSRLECLARTHLLVQRDVIATIRVLARRLRRIQRQIGVAHQLCGIVPVRWRFRDADTHAQMCRMPVKQKWPIGDRLYDPQGQSLGRIWLRSGEYENSKFVAAKPSDYILFP